ncbi:multidrug ABC transporter ATP-binding protein [Salinivibrio kushneri]|uniref:Multidrug ABC transporter ATP-binding protein n=2 Tax=Salinivibrio TaxID=51366 RepID=A0AB36JU62_9GAMM|nr:MULTISPECIES: ABC-F family ATP-binding cassette domain-containing protein [Salinivibrio]ODP96114.1 multidrug ABC transporter ATP-binding protein [Salinivibrio sp. BNH]OOE38472.1 multidrug ABC transporter ATP-binding protein [Salinivibrio kushneri]QCP03801.1 ABC-F family ATP-binding cassette domain-containing protein [Salinivibrio kushneri]
MSLLVIENICFQIEEKVLYQGASVVLHHGEHVGVTGANGVGKSTLLKMLQGELLPDSGEIVWQPNIQVGYLDQHLTIDPTLSIYDFMALAYRDLVEVERALNAIYASMSVDTSDAVLAKAARLQSQLEAQDFYRISHRIEQVAAGLGIAPLGMQTAMGQLSGGQRHKVMLAKLLLEQAEVMLLDEPTNFLDAEHVAWLAEFLNHYTGTFMVVSHDEAFLESITTAIVDIDQSKIRKYKGSYQQAMAQKAQQSETQHKQYVAQQKKMDKLATYIRKNGAGVNARIAKGRKKQLAKMVPIEKKQTRESISFAFQYKPLRSQHVLAAKGLQIGYRTPLLPPLSLQIQRGEKVAIIGFNGLGKSTLLKTLLGKIPALRGHIDTANGIKWGYFEQGLQWRYPESSPVQAVCGVGGQLTDKTARQKLAEFGLSGKKAVRPLRRLSGGEQTKVKLCCLAVMATNVLVLDEPTTHLDVDAKMALQHALKAYAGTVIVVSHEPQFIEHWPDKVIDMTQL